MGCTERCRPDVGAHQGHLGTRAVRRTIQPGYEQQYTPCQGCGERIKFRAKHRQLAAVIANVYEGGRWARLETWHSDCYVTAGEPWGKAC